MGLENPLHIIILLTLVLLIFGAKRLPEMGHSLGEGLRGFKEAINPHAASASEGQAASAPALSAASAPLVTSEPAVTGAPVDSRDLTPAG